MILRAALAIGKDAVKDVEHLARLNDESSLLQHLTADAILESLAEFQHATGNGPLALEGLGGAAHQQNSVAVHDDSANANNGLFGIDALHCVKKSLGLSPTSFQPLSPNFISKCIWVLRCTASWVWSAGVAAMSISAMATP